MNKTPLILLLLFINTTFATSAKQLASLLQRMQTFQAHFVQKTMDTKNRLLQKSQGTMQFMRPDRFRWETLKPTHQIVVANHKWLWVYDVDLMQVTKQAVNKAAMTPARVLSGNTQKLLAQFHVSTVKDGKLTKYVLLPIKKQNTYQSVAIYFNGKNLQGLSIINPLGQNNHFSFSKVKINLKLSTQLFQFTPPAGVDVLQS